MRWRERVKTSSSEGPLAYTGDASTEGMGEGAGAVLTGSKSTAGTAVLMDAVMDAVDSTFTGAKSHSTGPSYPKNGLT